jgi:hypothetical protein
MISIERSLRTAITALAFGMLPVSGGIAMAGSLGGPLQLQDEGSFFVNGQQLVDAYNRPIKHIVNYSSFAQLQAGGQQRPPSRHVTRGRQGKQWLAT